MPSEKNADALARGETDPGACRPGPVRRFARRSIPKALPIKVAASNCSDRSATPRTRSFAFSRANGLFNFETATTRGGVSGIVFGPSGPNSLLTEVRRDRDTLILYRIIRFLQTMGTLYRTARIPGNFSAPTFDASTGNYMSSVARTTPGEEE